MTVKRTVVDKLHHSGNSLSTYELMSLNALDKQAFKNITDRFDDDPVTIVNEELLMYLNRAEKETPCQHIHETLKQHGGSWITADIYFRFQMEETKQSW